MPPTSFRFDLHATDPATGARRGTFHTPHGPVETPAFMPVGTVGTVKGITPDHLRGTYTAAVLILALCAVVAAAVFVGRVSRAVELAESSTAADVRF